jgi:hypothetical protein
MRTDTWKFFSRPLLALTLAVGLTGAVVTTAAAQADTLERPPQPTPEAAAPAEFDEPADRGAEVAEGDDRISILGGSRTIEEGESVRDVLVIGGNLRVRGEVRGDAVVVGGNLHLYETGRIRGDVVVAGGRFRNHGGQVSGEMRTVDRVPGVATTTAREARQERRTHSPFGPISRGFAGVISTLAFLIVLGAVGAVLVFYGHRYLETVSDTLRASTMRSGAVGLAAVFLVFPAFVVLLVALAVSIVGIPLLLVAIPLYPLAIAAATLFGLLAAAYAIGERTAEQRKLYDLRHRNAYAYLGFGLLVLFGPVLMAHLIGMTPFLGWLGSLIKFFAYALIWVVMTAGFGAVILSRAGTRRTFARGLAAPDRDTILDEDPFLERSEV